LWYTYGHMKNLSEELSVDNAFGRVGQRLDSLYAESLYWELLKSMMDDICLFKGFSIMADAWGNLDEAYL